MVKTAFLFPGQGSFVPGILRHLADESSVSETLREADAIASGYGHRGIRSALIDGDGLRREGQSPPPPTVALAIFTTSVALHRLLRAERQRPDVLVGHSQGEIAALVAGGWLSFEDGFRLLCERETHLRESSPPGGLLATRLGVRRATGLVAVLGDGSAALAADNAPGQTVLSAAEDGLATVQKILAAMDIDAVRLRAPYPFHGPLLAGVTELLRPAVDGTDPLIGHTAVFSPILGRAVESTADARAVLRDHLVRPVRFRAAVSEVLAEGVERFVECGAKSTLIDLSRLSVPDSVEFIAPLARRVDRAGLRAFFDGSAAASEPLPVAAFPKGVPAPATAPSLSTSPAVAPAPAAPSALASTPAPAPAEADQTEAVITTNGTLPEIEVLTDELRQIFAETLGYPLDVLTDEVDLEADLGISSVKQIELLTTVLDRYDLPTPDSDIRPGLFPTLPDLAAYLRKLHDDAVAAA
ncbi:malonyl CoA-acyl carrier protein transacylase [Nocardia tenerifensis]|uniref:[acyl-carrier-protein] S-malonyltransferase n=1 Tax=Nocardia tenerifensis TaxID=228006 RepID=A0A318K8E7_9NOCA|nr:acyltransferase domain-containing protein [Nocardia tenerifensis]PXX69233.1 malonyl CoA-acyl carrier protein transacylase [Nocardia tenerifensis]